MISLQKIFKMSSFCLYANLEALAPLGDSTVDYRLIQIIPHFQQALLQGVDIMDSSLVDSLLHNAPHFLVHSTGFKSELFGGHNAGEIKSGVSLVSISMVSWVLWDGTLSC